MDGKKDTYWATDDSVTNASIEVDLGGEVEFNVARSEEMIALGQRVAQYKVESWSDFGKGLEDLWLRAQPSVIANLTAFPTVKASKVRLTIEKALACPTIKSFGIHLDTVSPPESFEPANANREYKRTPRQRN